MKEMKTLTINSKQFEVVDAKARSQLENVPQTIETALTQAKESGQFDGYTPVKGTDYFTEADKEEIINAIFTQVIDGSEVSY